MLLVSLTNNLKFQVKEFVGKNEEELILGGQDTCQGDSGGPLWVEENGKGISDC